MFFLFLFLAFLATATTSLYRLLFVAPASFPSNQIFTIEKGETLQEIARSLEKKGYIHNAKIFQWTVMYLESEKSIDAGVYSFENKLGTLTLAGRLAEGVPTPEVKEITFPEGLTVDQMAKIASEKFPSISSTKFILLAKSHEGFLFPDTYEFYADVSEKEIIATMRENFQEKTRALQREVQANGEHTFREIIIMASILEEEAKTTKSRRMVAGILWSRISIGMPLQVDATFVYFLGKNTYELTLEDLGVPSPYNTYTNLGLPLGPISNPGLDAIQSAMNPIPSKFLYYLSDRAGNLYYSKTLEGHRRYKEKYVN